MWPLRKFRGYINYPKNIKNIKTQKENDIPLNSHTSVSRHDEHIWFDGTHLLLSNGKYHHT